jgi:thiamine biosynthesis lipoprotein
MTLEPLHFHAQAMATTFELVLVHEDGEYAAQAAEAVFSEIARLEEELSRFRHTSDIWRLGLLKAGESMRLCLSAWDCLNLAKQVWRETSGAFDVTVGPLMNLWREMPGLPFDPQQEPLKSLIPSVGSQRFELDADELSIQVLATGMAFDLGAIGKGYALDQAAVLLGQWGLESAFLNAGDSTLLALDPPPGEEGWSVTLAEGAQQRFLCRQALSGSGFAVKGAHLMDPRQLKPLPLNAQRSYAIAPSAALSDALSTAFMVMSQEEIAALCGRYPGQIEAMRI